MKRLLFSTLVIILLGSTIPAAALSAAAPTTKVIYQPLPKLRDKIPLGTDHYFSFNFVKPPKIGVTVMRVEVFTLDGKKDMSFVVKGDADMPSMRGAHSTGDKDFSLSAKGVYLLPVRLVMPGDWEIKFTFVKNGKVAFRGAYLFDI